MNHHPCRKAVLTFLLILSGILVSACAPSGEDQSRASGEDLFQANCGDCHGASGRGPSLDQLRSLTSEELRAAIRNHPTAGQIPQRLPANEIGGIIEYLDE